MANKNDDLKAIRAFSCVFRMSLQLCTTHQTGLPTNGNSATSIAGIPIALQGSE